MSKILIVEDEPGISNFLTKGLTSAGYGVTVAADGKTAVKEVMTETYDLMILDIGLPDIDGFEVLEIVRGQGYKLPIIMLTARKSLEDTLNGLEHGADDYMTKPLRFEELLARIHLRIRSSENIPSSMPTTLTVGRLTLDMRTRRVSVNGRQVDLSAREFTMLRAFMEHPDQVLSRSQLLDMAWGSNTDPGSNVVDVYVRYLRKKIGNEHITTIRGMGYRLIAI